MRKLCLYFIIFYLCGLFVNASLILIVLLNWPMDMLPFWFRLLFAAAPFFFFAAGAALRKDCTQFGKKDYLLSALIQCGILLAIGVILVWKAPDSVLCWFLSPVSGDLIAAFGSISTWKPLYSLLNAVGAPLLFTLGALCFPILHGDANAKKD